MVLKRELTQSLLDQLPEPKNVWKYFLWCTEIPRPSHKLERFESELKSLAPKLGCTFDRDEIGNIVLKIPASPGCEDVPTVGVQGHIDMVCEKTPETFHNFETDPINPLIDGNFLKAKGTTLGADDGIGVAACLALAEESAKFRHGALEFLFTVNEETDMSGAENLAAKPFLSCDYMINVDSEEEGRICIGCAGGSETTFKVPIITSKNVVDENHSNVVFDVHIGDVTGGHTGIDIHKNRANAIKILTAVLRGLNDDLASVVRMVHFEGGNLVNAIPRNSFTKLVVPENHSEALRHALIQNFNTIKNDFNKTDPNMSIKINVNQLKQNDIKTLCTSDSMAKILQFIESVPHGVIRMIPTSADGSANHVVETSNSLSRVEMKNDHLFVHTFGRSSNDEEMRRFERSLKELGQEYDAQVSEPFAVFPGWQPIFDSELLTKTKGAAQDVFGKDPDVYAVHAGLECGFVQAKYPKMQCVSIGPQIDGAHSPDERIDIPSVERFYAVLKRTIEKIAA